MNHTEQRIIVGMSGGVDSSVAALLLKEQGYQVEGLFMKNWEEDDKDDYCSAAQDLQDAQCVCEHLKIPLHSVNFATEYWDRVFAYFLHEYRSGRTPNPDVICNKEIKFKAFLEYALEALGAERIATGHYARVIDLAGDYRLQRAMDENKDQTYFLYLLNQQQLSRSLFPIGHLHKRQVRQLAESAGFANHRKKDSTGICFIGERKFRDFLSRYLPANPGIIEDTQGLEIGYHQGLMYYTLGQRQGLGIGGRKDSPEAPWFVVRKDLERNVLVAAQGHEHPLLMSRELLIEQLHWISDSHPPLPARFLARVRHRQPLQPCEIRPQDADYRITFETPQRAATPGQSVVFYDSLDCLGGGIIKSINR
ncbi:MAG: tRNA 2-thiouridine(34) synthase MnmA [Gammaproteobacteria bacterium]|nr:tRNA 2-thiouridine(34) synthase MnmA [Gammaproteobacteria bacterium]